MLPPSGSHPRTDAPHSPPAPHDREQAGRFALGEQQRSALDAQLRRAVRGARRHGDCVAAVSWRLADGVDPSAVVLGSRGAGDPWMCFEQPDRERTVVATLGAVVALEDRGHLRFERTAARWRDLVARACVEPSARTDRRGPDRRRRLRLRARRRRHPALVRFRSGLAASCPRWRWSAELRRSGARSRPWCARTTSRSSCWRASSDGSRRCASCRCRCSIPIRPSVTRSPARWLRSTTRRRSRGPSS